MRLYTSRAVWVLPVAQNSRKNKAMRAVRDRRLPGLEPATSPVYRQQGAETRRSRLPGPREVREPRDRRDHRVACFGSRDPGLPLSAATSDLRRLLDVLSHGHGKSEMAAPRTELEAMRGSWRGEVWRGRGPQRARGRPHRANRPYAPAGPVTRGPRGTSPSGRAGCANGPSSLHGERPDCRDWGRGTSTAPTARSTPARAAGVRGAGRGPSPSCARW